MPSWKKRDPDTDRGEEGDLADESLLLDDGMIRMILFPASLEINTGGVTTIL